MAEKLSAYLYTLDGCPKCDILRKKCNESPKFLAAFNFCEIKIHRENQTEADREAINYLASVGHVDMPVLCIDGLPYSFENALNMLRSEAFAP